MDCHCHIPRLSSAIKYQQVASCYTLIAISADKGRRVRTQFNNKG